MILEAELEHINPTTAVARLNGRMTLGMRLREIETKISNAIGDGVQRLILDLSGIEFLDSAGLGVIMILYGNMQERGGKLRVVAPGPRVMEVFKLTHTDWILTIDSNLEAALVS